MSEEDEEKPMPKIRIPKHIWKELIESAREAKGSGIPLRAFFLFSRRGSPLEVTRCKEVPVKIIKESSPSGPIFRWNIERYEEYYLPRKHPESYCGTVLIKKDLDMTLHYAYFMGIGFRHRKGFNTNLWIGDDGKAIYKAFYVHSAKLETTNQTHGEFVPIAVEVTSN